MYPHMNGMQRPGRIRALTGAVPADNARLRFSTECVEMLRCGFKTLPPGLLSLNRGLIERRLLDCWPRLPRRVPLGQAREDLRPDGAQARDDLLRRRGSVSSGGTVIPACCARSSIPAPAVLPRMLNA